MTKDGKAAELLALKVLGKLGHERVHKGLNSYREYASCCRSWRSCFLAQALGVSEADVDRHDPNMLDRIAKMLNLSASEIDEFITIFDDAHSMVSTKRLQEMCYAFLRDSGDSPQDIAQVAEGNSALRELRTTAQRELHK